MDVKIRPAEQNDHTAIKQLLCSLPGVWQNQWRKHAVSIALKSAGELALVAIIDEEIVGFMCVHDVGFRAYISEMAILEKYQKLGIGSQLLNRAEKNLSSKQCKLIVADVYPPAEGFYRNNGWAKPSSTLLIKDIKTEKG